MHKKTSLLNPIVLAMVILSGACGVGQSTPQRAVGRPAFVSTACEFVVPDGYEVNCGDLIVPENRSQPDSPDVRLHVGIFRSKSAKPAPDPVILLDGGPGANTLGRSAWLLQRGGDQILETRDYILFSQRGTHYAEPSLECPRHKEFAQELMQQPLNHHERKAQELEFLLACQEALVAQGIDLTAYNSAENAADVKDLWEALGYERVNLYGGSYGTRLALTVMRDHPEAIRSVIIDAVLPPQVGFDVELAASADRAFSALFDGCAAADACDARYPNLGEVFYRAVDELNANPTTVRIEERTVTVWMDGDVFMDAIHGSLYRTDAIPWIPMMIYEVSRGNPEGIGVPLEVAYDRDPVSTGMYYSVMCREEVVFEAYEDALARAAALPPQLVEHFAAFAFTLCESWRSGQASPVENEPVVSDIPTLVLTGQYDPVTPPAFGQLAAESLANSFFYEFPGTGHCPSFSNSCALDIVLAFLDDPGKEPDASCTEKLAGPDFQ
jgi:pimeloyl-ACP methyl ester carboxylesterase